MLNCSRSKSRKSKNKLASTDNQKTNNGLLIAVGGNPAHFIVTYESDLDISCSVHHPVRGRQSDRTSQQTTHGRAAGQVGKDCHGTDFHHAYCRVDQKPDLGGCRKKHKSLEPRRTQRAQRRAFLCRERKLPRRHREEKKAFPLCLRDSVAKAFMTEGDKPSS